MNAVRLLAPPAAFMLTTTLALAQAGEPSKPQCQRDLFFAKSSLSETRAIETAPIASRCVAWRAHIDTVKQAEAVFARCLQGQDRTQAMAEMAESAAGFGDLLRRQCPKGL